MKILCVGRGYLGKALAEFDDFDVISHQTFTKYPDVVSDYNGVVNCAGIVGHRKCDEEGYDPVIEANVKFAVTLQNNCLAHGVHFIQPSTIGISLRQWSTAPEFLVSESMPIYPHNLYCASKILNEHALNQQNTTILRLPWVVVPGTFESRIQNWKEVQSTICSIIELEDLRCALLNTLRKRAVGVYNIKTTDVYFPDFIKARFGLDLPERETGTNNMTASVPMDTRKARAEGILDYER